MAAIGTTPFKLGGGADTVDAGGGNDVVELYYPASGSFLTGGAGTDTLRVMNFNPTLGSITGFEAIDMAAGTTLTVTGSQFKTGFASNTVLSGSGALVIDMSAANPVFSITGITVAGGSSVGVTINGTSGLDQIKGIINWANTINGGDGVDQDPSGRQFGRHDQWRAWQRQDLWRWRCRCADRWSGV